MPRVGRSIVFHSESGLRNRRRGAIVAMSRTSARRDKDLGSCGDGEIPTVLFVFPSTSGGWDAPTGKGCCRDNPPRKRWSVRAHPGQHPHSRFLGEGGRSVNPAARGWTALVPWARFGMSRGTTSGGPGNLQLRLYCPMWSGYSNGFGTYVGCPDIP